MGDIKAGLDPNAGGRTSAAAPLDPDKQVNQGSSDGSVRTYSPEDRGAVQSGAMKAEDSLTGRQSGVFRGKGEGPISVGEVAPHRRKAIILSPTLAEQAIMICPAPRNHLLANTIMCGSCKPLYEMLARKIAVVREDCAKVADAIAAVGEGPVKDLAERIAGAIRKLEIDGVKGDKNESGSTGHAQKE